MFTYCLFCETGKCRFVAHEVMSTLENCLAISPRQIQHTWQNGKMTDRARDLLPGYLFLYSCEPVDISPCRYIPGVLRCLKTSENDYVLTGNDETFALMILKMNGVIGKTPVYEEDQRIRLTEGALAGVEAVIRKVDHRAHRMQIEVPFARTLVKTWVEYEVVTPDEPETTIPQGTEGDAGWQETRPTK